MRKLLSFLTSALLLIAWSDLNAQCTLSANNPTDLAVEFCMDCLDMNKVGDMTLGMGGTVEFTLPDDCGGTPYTLGNSLMTPIIINVNNDDLVVPGSIEITGKIDFDGDGNATIDFGGLIFSANGSIGGTYAELEAAINACLSSPPPGGCTAAAIAASLPVELASFQAISRDKMVELEWTTSSELNNNFFQIEHSLDAIEFYPVGKVKGNGTISEAVTYYFLHRQPADGVNYYRLKQVDFDGSFEYSNIKGVKVNERGGGVSIFPNPVTERALVTIKERPEIVKFTFTNLLGQGIDLQPVVTVKGWELDISGMATGIYLLRAEFQGKVITKRIVKE
ncbi:MAG: T9SS type A sorting domain-containing protein [Saprospiraceae bacterium]